jgi:hypothetical protein
LQAAARFWGTRAESVDEDQERATQMTDDKNAETSRRSRTRGALATTLPALVAGALICAGAARTASSGQRPVGTAVVDTSPVRTDASAKEAEALMAAQAPLLKAVERIRKLDPERNQLGGTEIQIETKTVTVWWKGEPSPELRKEVTAAETGGELKVVVRAADYGQRELLTAARGITRNAASYPGVVSVAPSPDGSGLEIGLVRREGASALKVPVRFRVFTSAPFVALATRGADTPPWSGGAVTQAASSACTTGFAMAQNSGPGIVTAQHCACGGNATFKSGAGVVLGVADPPSSTADLTDSLFIPTTSGPMMYGGGVGVGETSLVVGGTESNVVGMLVCVSGAASGMHCNIRIDKVLTARLIVDAKTKQLVCPSDLPFAEDLSEATQVNGTIASAAGDSGAPIFTTTTSGMVNAAGILAGGNPDVGGEVFCPTGLESCFSKIIFTDIDSIRSAHQAEVIQALGTSCSANLQCSSRYCDAGWGTSKTNRCMPFGNGNIGDICSNDNQCSSHVCAGLTTDAQGNWVPGACATKKALGDACSQNYQCASGNCDAGWGTSKTNRCMPFANGNIGDICSNDNQCSSQVCAGLTTDAQGNWVPGACATKKALGDACSQNYQCASGNCDSGWGTSKTDRCMPFGNGKSGDICSNNNQCSSQVCVGLHSQGNVWVPGVCQ